MANVKFSEFPSAATVGATDIIPILQGGVNKKATALIFSDYIGSAFVGLTGNQTVAGIKTFSSQLISTVAIGTAPFSVVSTTKVTNLNADLLDGLNSTAFIPYTGAISAIDLNSKSVVNISNLGIGTTTVPTILLRAIGDNNSNSRIAMRGYSSNANSSSIRVTKFRGTAGAPQAPLSGDSLGKFELAGYGTTSSDGFAQASFEGLATENWGATARGSKLVFKVTPNSTTTQVVALTLNQDKTAAFESSVSAQGVNIGINALGTDRMFQISGNTFTSGATQFAAVINPTMGAVTNLYGIYAGLTCTSATNYYALYLETATGTITNKWGIYQSGSGEKNYFAGNVGIGTTTPKSYASLTTSGQLISLGNIGVNTGENFRFNNYYNSGTISDRAISTGFAAGINLEAGSMIFKSSASSVSADTNVTLVERMRIKPTGVINISNIPTSAAGLSAGDIYSNLGILTIV